MREMQQLSFGFRQGQADQKAAGADKPTKPMPSGMQKAYLENRNSLNAVDRAISAHAAYPGAFGLSNVMGDAVKQRTDPKGVAARAAVADLGSLKIHDRSGAAVTAMEFPRLRPFIPSATDKPEVVKTEAGQLQGDLRGHPARDHGLRHRDELQDAVDAQRAAPCRAGSACRCRAQDDELG